MNTQTEIPNFLRFVTGSSVCIGRSITVEFNNLEGLARCPIAHTCSCVLELSMVHHWNTHRNSRTFYLVSSPASWMLFDLYTQQFH